MSNKKAARIKIDRDKFAAAITERGWTIHSFVEACMCRPFASFSERSFRRYMSSGEIPYAVFSEVASFLRIYPEDVIADGELNTVIFVDRERFGGTRFEGVQWKFADSDVVYSWYAESPEKALTKNETIDILCRIRDEEPDWTADEWTALDMAIDALEKEVTDADV